MEFNEFDFQLDSHRTLSCFNCYTNEHPVVLISIDGIFLRMKNETEMS